MISTMSAGRTDFVRGSRNVAAGRTPDHPGGVRDEERSRECGASAHVGERVAVWLESTEGGGVRLELRAGNLRAFLQCRAPCRSRAHR